MVTLQLSHKMQFLSLKTIHKPKTVQHHVALKRSFICNVKLYDNTGQSSTDLYDGKIVPIS